MFCFRWVFYSNSYQEKLQLSLFLYIFMCIYVYVCARVTSYFTSIRSANFSQRTDKILWTMSSKFYSTFLGNVFHSYLNYLARENTVTSNYWIITKKRKILKHFLQLSLACTVLHLISVRGEMTVYVQRIYMQACVYIHI